VKLDATHTGVQSTKIWKEQKSLNLQRFNHPTDNPKNTVFL